MNQPQEDSAYRTAQQMSRALFLLQASTHDGQHSADTSALVAVLTRAYETLRVDPEVIRALHYGYALHLVHLMTCMSEDRLCIAIEQLRWSLFFAGPCYPCTEERVARGLRFVNDVEQKRLLTKEQLTALVKRLAKIPHTLKLIHILWARHLIRDIFGSSHLSDQNPYDELEATLYHAHLTLEDLGLKTRTIDDLMAMRASRQHARTDKRGSK